MLGKLFSPGIFKKHSKGVESAKNKIVAASIRDEELNLHGQLLTSGIDEALGLNCGNEFQAVNGDRRRFIQFEISQRLGSGGGEETSDQQED
jgi:hypothetical protein